MGVELNGVPSYVGHMKKLLTSIRNLFKPKKHWMEEAYEAWLKEHEAEVAYVASCEEEIELTQGRPVILMPPSATIH